MTLPGGKAPAIWRARKYTGPERRRTKRWRPRPLRVLLVLLIVAAIGYGAAVVWLITQETRIVFQAGRTLATGRPAFPYEQVDLPRADGARQFAWVMRRTASDDGPWVLFLHGNAATIASKVNIAHYTELRALGLNVLAPEYRGFGGLDGSPTEAVLEADARAAYDYLHVTRRIAPDRIVIYGWSLGGAVAVNLAAQTEEAAVILEGAPAAVVDIGQLRHPFFPIRLIMRNPFNSIGKIERIGSPMLFLHGMDDAVVPISEGRRLFAAARGDKTFVEVRGGHVTASEEDGERFYGAIRQFLKLPVVENGEVQ
jgi:pimeloyl-ACP methyl ester carboxylesterase